MKFLIMIVLLSASIFAQGIRQDPPNFSDPIDNVFLARANEDGKPGEEVSTFLPKDVPIFCVVTLTEFKIADVKMNLVAVKVNGVRPETKIVTSSYRTKQGQNRVIFTGSPDGFWSSGNYRIDIFIDGLKLRSVSFNVVEPPRQQKFVPVPAKSKPRKG
ncbi:MAG: hypothetical protein AB1477_04600 [Acidobacteriota bacterium]|jgi:hypothetical protein